MASLYVQSDADIATDVRISSKTTPEPKETVQSKQSVKPYDEGR